MPIPQPRAEESQSQFIGRCNSALADEFPETEQRNAVCFGAWRESKQSKELERLAREAFPDEKFVTIRNKAIFDEHETELPDGEKKVYDRKELVAIAETCNQRILDTGDFSPITDGHTPDEEGLPDPDILGFASNFRVGLLGNKTPRWAIFVDEHISRDEEERAKKKPRISVEIWPTDRVIDPIARLGATTPRRDLGLRPTFSKGPGGKVKYRYSMKNAAEPSSTNVFVPGFGTEKDREKLRLELFEKNQAKDPPAACGNIWFNGTDEQRAAFGKGTEGRDRGDKPPKAWFDDCVANLSEPSKEKNQMPIDTPTTEATLPVEGNDDTVQRVIDALMETPQFKFLTNLMEETVPTEEAPEEEPEELARHNENDEDEPEKDQADEDEPEDEDEKMRRIRNSRKAARDSALEVQKLRKKVERMEADRVADRKRDLDRYKRSELERLSPHFVYDVEDELTLCEKMSESQFDDHCEQQIIQKYRQKPTGMRELATDNSVTQPPPGHGDKMKYEADLAERAKVRAVSLRNEGKEADYDSIRAELQAADEAAGTLPS